MQLMLTPVHAFAASLFSGISGGGAALIALGVMALFRASPGEALAAIPMMLAGGIFVVPIAGLVGAPFSVPVALVAGSSMYFAGRRWPVVRSAWAWAPVGAAIGAAMSQTVDLYAIYLGTEGDSREGGLQYLLVPGIVGGVAAALVFRQILRWDADEAPD
jgi:hypothetical protein